MLGFKEGSTFIYYANLVITFVLVCIGWVFFRASNINEAFYIISHFGLGLGTFIMHSYDYYTWKNLLSLSGLIQKKDVIISLVGIGILVIVDSIERTVPLWQKVAQYPSIVRWGVYYAMFFGIITFGLFGVQEFIYFQF
jgi:hypothetical protein